jgi:predicted transcriptional regulator
MLYLKVDLGLLSLVCNKQKDAAQFSNIKFGLKVIELPGGASSCVITETAEAVMGSPSDPSKPVVQNPNYRKALEVLAKNFPSDGATATQWMKETGLVEKTFYRARENLERLGLVEKSGEGQGARYGLTDTGRKVLSLSPNCHSAVATVP